MIFVIGGSYQGKCEFVRKTYQLKEEEIFICTEDTREIDFTKRAVAHIERFALGCIRRGEEPAEYWKSHIEQIGNMILISDDVSCGVVPIDETIRAWREANGRANNYLAGQAERVWRVFCGLGQVLK